MVAEPRPRAGMSTRPDNAGGNSQLIETSLGDGVAAGDKDASMLNTQHHSFRIILWCVAD